MRKVLTVLFAALALGACQTQAQRTVEVYNSTWQNATVQMMGCLAPLLQSEHGKIYTSLFLLGPSDPARLKKLTLARQMTDSEKVALFKYSEAVTPCRQIMMRASSQTYAPYVSIHAQFFSEFDGLWASVLSDRITIGEANGLIMDLSQRYSRDMVAAEQRYNQLIAQQHNEEIRQRQAAITAFQNYVAQQQALTEQRAATQSVPAFNPPVRTVCNLYGNTVTCLSR